MVTNKDMAIYGILQYAYHSYCDMKAICENAPEVEILNDHVHISTDTDGSYIGKNVMEPEDVSVHIKELVGMLDNQYTELILYNPSAVKQLQELVPNVETLFSNKYVTVYKCSIDKFSYTMVVSANSDVCVVAKQLMSALHYKCPTSVNLTFTLPFCRKYNCRCVCSPEISYSDLNLVLESAYATTIWQLTTRNHADYQYLNDAVCAGEYEKIVEALTCIDGDLPDKVNELLESMLES